MQIIKKLPVILACLIVAFVSIFWLVPYTTDVENHEASIERIDDKISKVLKLTAGATAASAAMSLLPDDVCTPIAQEVAELAKYFLVVLSALYVEKYTLTLIGFVSFGILIPMACIMVMTYFFNRKKNLKQLAVKFVVFAVCIYVSIPASLGVSDKIYQTYENKIDNTISQADQISIVNEGESSVNNFLDWIKNAATTVISYSTDLLGSFIETIAVMIVTACIIPLLVLVFILWLLKYLFGINTPVAVHVLPPLKRLKKADTSMLEQKAYVAIEDKMDDEMDE